MQQLDLFPEELKAAQVTMKDQSVHPTFEATVKTAMEQLRKKDAGEPTGVINPFRTRCIVCGAEFTPTLFEVDFYDGNRIPCPDCKNDAP